ncbi:MAG: signal recognition particle protein [SAR324 cluster bacterium]|jgi:signal recognition particle subunit SRP54|nr:signal recognition particle protein [SAR324 cluster bacterium]MDP7046040.1 signal recognition particle protein [SAR324 cluster bacterium]
MFETLSDKLSGSLRKVRGRGRLTEDNVGQTLNEVKMALLEADVNFRVVKAFLRSVKARAVGEEVQGSLTPGQQFIKIVNEELTEMMGGANSALAEPETAPLVTMLVGLQGSGKTSSVGKLARLCKTEGKRPYLIPADIYRPAAIRQLEVLAETLGVSCYPSTTEQNPLDIVRNGLEAAKQEEADAVFIDTAGRLHIDQELMEELSRIKESVMPHEIIFVADAMTGQEAVSVAKGFNDRLDISGVMLTKMDGDARGGAALSIRAITQKPIKFITVGEKLENLEAFHPERIASRILGMGDMLSLIEKVEDSFSEREALQMQKKLKSNEFTLEDFRDQLRSMRKMGSMKDVIGMLPGMNASSMKDANVDEKKLVHIDAIISSMTIKERQNHKLMNGSRRMRVAKGSGTSVSEINKLLKQFVQMRKMMQKLLKVSNPGKAMRMMQDMMPN